MSTAPKHVQAGMEHFLKRGLAVGEEHVQTFVSAGVVPASLSAAYVA